MKTYKKVIYTLDYINKALWKSIYKRNETQIIIQKTKTY